MAVDLMEIFCLNISDRSWNSRRLWKRKEKRQRKWREPRTGFPITALFRPANEATLAYYERLLQISNIGATLEERRRILLLSGIWNPFIHFRS